VVKKISPIVAFFIPWIWPAFLWAAPASLNLQGRLTDAEGNPLTRPTQVDFYLFQGGHPDVADEGTIIYKERVILAPDAEGLYEHHLGEGTPLESHTLTPEDFDTELPLYLQMMIQGSPLLPRLQILSNGYAMLASRVARGSIRPDNMDLASFRNNGAGLVPPGAILLFQSSCPEGFSEVTELRNRIPIGVDAASTTPFVPDQINQQVGNFGHQHPISHSHTSDVEFDFSGTQNIGTGQDWVSFSKPLLIKKLAALGGGDAVYLEGHSHRHPISDPAPAISGTSEGLPPSLTVMFCRKN